MQIDFIKQALKQQTFICICLWERRTTKWWTFKIRCRNARDSKETEEKKKKKKWLKWIAIYFIFLLDYYHLSCSQMANSKQSMHKNETFNQNVKQTRSFGMRKQWNMNSIMVIEFSRNWRKWICIAAKIHFLIFYTRKKNNRNVSHD